MKVTSNQQDFYQIKQENRKDATVSAVILTLPPHFFFFSFFHFLLPSHFQRRGRFLLFILPLPTSFFVFFLILAAGTILWYVHFGEFCHLGFDYIVQSVYLRWGGGGGGVELGNSVGLLIYWFSCRETSCSINWVVVLVGGGGWWGASHVCQTHCCFHLSWFITSVNVLSLLCSSSQTNSLQTLLQLFTLKEP